MPSNTWSSCLTVRFLGFLCTAIVGLVSLAGGSTHADERPNILFAIADDWGWPHAGAYGDPVVKTPTFDRLAREGVLCRHAYVSSPSCTPSRNAILTGQWHWRLGGSANLWSEFSDELETYPELLQADGYQTGHTGKAYGPGRTETPGRHVAGKRYRNFATFLSERDPDKPFCFWLGSSDPHRPYKAGSGEASGMELDKIDLPACFPDVPEVRSDVADYYWEVQRFDRLVGSAVAELEKAGLLDDTIVMMTGDHGMPFPRCKSNLYDSGTRVPLAIRWPGGGVPGGAVVESFVSLTDIAPTFLEIAGLMPSNEVTGRSLVELLQQPGGGPNLTVRDYVLVGKERHVPSQEAPDMGGYPCRGIRTHDFFYIQNLRPDRWPNGTPDHEKAARPGFWYADTDNGPTKSYMVENRDKDAEHRRLYDLSFAKRPAEELYDLSNDPDQLRNVASDPKYATVKKRLANQLKEELRATNDPRVVGGGDAFDNYPYLGGGPKYPGRR